MKPLTYAIVGATGLVGRQMVRGLAESNLPVKEVRLLATARSAGLSMLFRGEEAMVRETTPEVFHGVDIALFSAGASAAKHWVPEAVKRGAVVIDNSKAFRMDPAVPLVVPEVNGEDVQDHSGIIANPNCSTIQMVVVLKPLADAAGLTRVVVSTYQSVSGSGWRAMEELKKQVGAISRGEEPVAGVYPYPIAFNVLPHIDAFLPNGFTVEEMKMVNETRKILHMPDLAVTATTARVPVFIGHSESVYIETMEKLTAEQAREILKKAPGVIVEDEPAKRLYPLPIRAAGHDEVYVGRIREDITHPRGLNLWIVADNLRKGAATNALQIAALLARNWKGDLER